MPGEVLIIDDEEPLRKLLGRLLTLEGFHVREAGTLKDGLTIIGQGSTEVILCDVKLPDGNGVEFVKTAKAKYPICEFILLTAFGNIPDGVLAIKNGAFDYITKGNDNDRIIPLLHQAVGKVAANKASAIKVRHETSIGFNNILGENSLIKEAIKMAQRISATDSTVILLGETGTGKEVFANAIHFAGNRARKPLVAINCSAFPKDLLESELFGHKAGAFTNAVKDKKGLIEIADHGTLFLDEVGEMDLLMQTKLLRVLETGEFIKVGDEKTSSSDVRIIAATNRDLRKEIANGHFREDLFYRLNVFSIQLPALRERINDIPTLAQYFVNQFSKKENKPPLRLSKDSLDLLNHYSWPGNIRELRNTIERATILSDGAEILPEQLPYEIQKQNTRASSDLSLSAIEKEHIERVLHYTNGNKTKAAAYLGIGLTTLYRKIEEYGLH